MSSIRNTTRSRSSVPATDTSLISVRVAVVLLLAVLVGLAAGALHFASERDLAKAVLAGSGAAGLGVEFFRRCIGG